MFKRFTILCLSLLLIFSCTSLPKKLNKPQDHNIKITVEQINTGEAKLKVETPDGKETIIRTMEMHYSGMRLSDLSGIEGDMLYIKLFSGLSVSDVTRVWNDLIFIEAKNSNIKNVNLFIDSPGGDAFSGLALADQIEKYQKKGYNFIAHATGIIASAAVPVFAVCNETHATNATIFMVHEAALWKWPGRESASDIRAQGKLMDLLQKLYIEKLAKNSNLTFDDWVLLESKTSWFDVEEAKKIGILDFID